MFGRALTSVPWGMIADRYGRKPVILFGTIMLSVQLIIVSYFAILIDAVLQVSDRISHFCLSTSGMTVSGLFSILFLALVQTFGWQFLQGFFLEVCVVYLAQ